MSADGGNVSNELLITTCCEPQTMATAFKRKKLLGKEPWVTSAFSAVTGVTTGTNSSSAATSTGWSIGAETLLTLGCKRQVVTSHVLDWTARDNRREDERSENRSAGEKVDVGRGNNVRTRSAAAT